MVLRECKFIWWFYEPNFSYLKIFFTSKSISGWIQINDTDFFEWKDRKLYIYILPNTKLWLSVVLIKLLAFVVNYYLLCEGFNKPLDCIKQLKCKIGYLIRIFRDFHQVRNNCVEDYEMLKFYLKTIKLKKCIDFNSDAFKGPNCLVNVRSACTVR